MREALDFLVGKFVKVVGQKNKGILIAGYLDGTYRCQDLKFNVKDVVSIKFIDESVFIYLNRRLSK